MLTFVFFSFSFSLQLQHAVARELRGWRRRGFECTLFATAVKSLRSREERGFAKLKRFIQIECTRTEGNEKNAWK